MSCSLAKFVVENITLKEITRLTTAKENFALQSAISTDV
jgi:hypothetical protein